MRLLSMAVFVLFFRALSFPISPKILNGWSESYHRLPELFFHCPISTIAAFLNLTLAFLIFAYCCILLTESHFYYGKTSHQAIVSFM